MLLLLGGDSPWMLTSKLITFDVICFVIWSSKKGRTGDARASGRDEGRGFVR